MPNTTEDNTPSGVTLPHAAPMEISKTQDAAPEPPYAFFSELKSRRSSLIVLALCVGVLVVSYVALTSTPTSLNFNRPSFLPQQIRTFLGIQAKQDDDDDQGDPAQVERRVIERAAMANKTVIIATLNAAWAKEGTMIDMFLESFHNGNGTQELLGHLVVVCVDEKAYRRCRHIHSHCLRIQTPGVDFSGEQLLLSHDYIKLMWRRIQFLKTVLELNYDFIFTDTDILWFRNPLPRLQSDMEADFQIACDYYNRNPWDVHNSPNAGFTYVRANERTIKFYDYWYEERRRGSHMADQEVFNAIKFEDAFRSIGMKLRFLDTQFFGGFCAIRTTDMTKAITMHATCCKGLEAKLIDLRVILDDWKRWWAHYNFGSSIPQRRGGNVQNPSAQLASSNKSLVINPKFKMPRACPESWHKH